MKQFALIISWILFIPLFCYSQKGNPFITNFNFNENSSEIWSMAQDNQGLMLMAGIGGIEAFDGQHVQKIKTPTRPYILYRDPTSGRVFVGGSSGLGYLERGRNLQYSYHSLSNTKTDAIVYIASDKSMVYFTSENNVYVVSLSSLSLDNVIEYQSGITGVLKRNGRVLVSTARGQLIDISSPTAREIAPLACLAEQEVLFSQTMSNGATIFATTANRIYLSDENTCTELKLNDSTFFAENMITSGALKDDNTLVVTTLLGGIAVIDLPSHQIRKTIGYANGLPDDEIKSLTFDNNNGIWVSHSQGVSRIDMSLPVSNWSSYPGLKGTLLSLARVNGMLYVGTSEGLFVLDEIKTYDEKEVTKEVKTIKHVVEQVPHAKKRGFMFFKRKESTQAVEKQVEEIRSIKKKIRTLAQSYHAFVKVPGINDKCRHLLYAHGVLWVACSNGLHLVEGRTSSELVASSYITYLGAVPGSDLILVASSKGLCLVKEKKVISSTLAGTRVNCVYAEANGNVWIATEASILKTTVKNNTLAGIEEYSLGNEFHQQVTICERDGTIEFFADGEVFAYNGKDKQLEKKTGVTYKTLIRTPQACWVEGDDGYAAWSTGKQINTPASKLVGLFDNVSGNFIDSNGDVWLIDNNSSIYKIENKPFNGYSLGIHVNQVACKHGHLLPSDSLQLASDMNSLVVGSSAPFFLKSSGVMYAHALDNTPDGWSKWTDDPLVELNYLPSGTYTLKIKARDRMGNVSNEARVLFSVAKPFTQTLGFFVLVVLASTLCVFIFMKWQSHKLRKDNEVLERRVRERTRTIEQQKEEIEEQRDGLARQNEEILQHKEEIEAQRDEIEAQRDKIMEQNHHIMQSITYAKRIQNAVMPRGEFMQKLFPEHFTLFMPRDIVSGDFYWSGQIGSKVIIAAADCTGHGIPGAFMSMLGVSLINEIVLRNNETKAEAILNQLRESIINTLSESDKYGESKDGMDMSLCVIDKQAKTLSFSGANNPLVIVRDGGIIELEANRMPIGRHVWADKPFISQEITIHKNDVIYLYSDGFEDQFGGPHGKKFKKKQLRELFVSITRLPLSQQKLELEKAFEHWRGGLDQVDDVLIMGIKL